MQDPRKTSCMSHGNVVHKCGAYTNMTSWQLSKHAPVSVGVLFLNGQLANSPPFLLCSYIIYTNTKHLKLIDLYHPFSFKLSSFIILPVRFHTSSFDRL